MSRASYIEPNNCLRDIRKYYNITEDSVIPTIKIDWYNNIDYNRTDIALDRLSEISFQILNPYDKKPVNESVFQTICNNSELTFYVNSPGNNKQMSLNYEKFKQIDVDIYDPSDRFFNDKCFIYKNETNTMDVPLVTRKTDIFLGTSYICGQNCTFNGTSIDNYVICKCPPTYHSKILVEHKSFDDYSHTNIDILSCVYKITIDSNIGFIVLIILFIITSVCITTSCLLFNKHLRIYLRDIIYSDCNTLITKHTIEKKGIYS
jgi:hypothetical protein